MAIRKLPPPLRMELPLLQAELVQAPVVVIGVEQHDRSLQRGEETAEIAGHLAGVPRRHLFCAENADQFLKQLLLACLDLGARRLEVEGFETVDFGELHLSARSRRPLDRDCIAAEIAGVAVALKRPGMDELASFLPNRLQGNQRTGGAHNRQAAEQLEEICSPPDLHVKGGGKVGERPPRIGHGRRAAIARPT